MKKLLPIFFCVLFTFGFLVLWNWAEAFAKMTDTNTQLFDSLAAILFVAALSCSCWYYDIKHREDEERKTPNK